MSLTLHFHPLASYCWKALIALYENDIPFRPNLVDLGNAGERAALVKLWGVGKFPVLRDDARNETVPESSIIVEYLAGSALPPPGSTVSRDNARPYEITEVRRQSDGQLNVFVREIIKQ